MHSDLVSYTCLVLNQSYIGARLRFVAHMSVSAQHDDRKEPPNNVRQRTDFRMPPLSLNGRPFPRSPTTLLDIIVNADANFLRYHTTALKRAFILIPSVYAIRSLGYTPPEIKTVHPDYNAQNGHDFNRTDIISKYVAFVWMISNYLFNQSSLISAFPLIGNRDGVSYAPDRVAFLPGRQTIVIGQNEWDFADYLLVWNILVCYASLTNTALIGNRHWANQCTN